MSWIWPRPWIVAWAASIRSSVQRTGWPSLRASNADELLGVDVEFRAEAPTDRRRHDPQPDSGTPVTAASMVRRMCGICVEA